MGGDDELTVEVMRVVHNHLRQLLLKLRRKTVFRLVKDDQGVLEYIVLKIAESQFSIAASVCELRKCIIYPAVMTPYLVEP